MYSIIRRLDLVRNSFRMEIVENVQFSFFVLVTGLLLGGLSSTGFAAAPKQKSKPVSVLVEKLSPIPFYEELKYISNLKPFREVQVFSYIDGNVETKFKNNGAKVKKGESIAAIKNITPGYSYSNHVVKAPVTGIITGFYEEVGAFIKKGPPILTIADVSQWRVAIPMPQEDLGTLNQGVVRVVIRPSGQGDFVEGRLLRVAPDVDPVLGTSIVEFVFPQASIKNARLGMITELRVQHSRVNSIGIDEKFLMESRSKKKKYVYVVKADLTAHRRYLETGVTRDGKVQILGGLQSGEVIVTQMPNWGLKPGAKVAPQNKVKFEETLP